MKNTFYTLMVTASVLAFAGHANAEELKAGVGIGAKTNNTLGSTILNNDTSSTVGVDADVKAQTDMDAKAKAKADMMAKDAAETKADMEAKAQAKTDMMNKEKAEMEAKAKMDAKEKADMMSSDNAEMNADMDANANASASANAPSSAKMSRDDIKDIQQTLKGAGYKVSADGYLGPNTQQAIRSFQTDNNLTVTGFLDQNTLNSINAGAGATSKSKGMIQ